MKYQVLFSFLKKQPQRKNYSRMSSAAIVIGAFRVKILALINVIVDSLSFFTNMAYILIQENIIVEWSCLSTG